MRIVVTGAAGLLGTHAAIRLHALNCAARFRGEREPFDLVRLDRAGFGDPDRLAGAVAGAAAVLHFAGVNRGPDAGVETANPAIAEALAAACRTAGAAPHVVYANSIHAGGATAYGRSKAQAGAILAAIGGPYTDLVLPHVFGEGARPHYNNVTATLIDRLLAGETPEVNRQGRVALLHAGAAADAAIAAARDGVTGEVRPEPRPMSVPDLLEKLRSFHALDGADIYPDLSDPFDAALYNTYRAATYPGRWPRALRLNSDRRGRLFEAARGGGGGQTFVSATEPGVTRGDHFHLAKVERFLVLAGEAVVRMRKALGHEVWQWRVSGDAPAALDMPTLHSHSIENVGPGPLLTLFWTSEIFDASRPDTYADPVLQ
ncbi:MAG TPA: NAD-dependent epimerase/dehydratase family protein [Thermohalobaculum sp.]|nr:NAD-dependent epimerase/dehydratase family protein [Thermohalobaculum sp.]